jgi:hypothetical protein
MECNIDARGRAVRFTGGLIIVLAATVLAVLLLFGVLAGRWWWIVIAGLAAFGGFGIYEARAGWCAVRAMGFKTRV